MSSRADSSAGAIGVMAMMKANLSITKSRCIASLLAAVAMYIALGFAARAGEIHELIIHDVPELNEKTGKAETDLAVKFLETNSAAIEERDASKCTPLHYAAQYSRTNVVKWLIKHKVDVNAAAYNNYTPLFLTTNGAIAKLLIHGGADRALRDASGRTPLQHAAQMQRFDVVKAILDSGYPLDLTSALMLGLRDEAKKIIKHKPEQVKHPEPDSDLWGNTTPLGIAAGNGDAEMVALLLAAGAPVNAITQGPTMGPMTPLCNAVWGGHYEAAALLCKAGADCNVTGGKFYPHLLDFAQTHSDPKLVQLLVQYGAKPGP